MCIYIHIYLYRLYICICICVCICMYMYVCMYIYMGVSINGGTPKLMVYFMKNPIRMDDFGVPSSHGDGGSQLIPSGNLTVGYWTWPIEIVDLPIQHGDFPVRKLLVRLPEVLVSKTIINHPYFHGLYHGLYHPFIGYCKRLPGIKSDTTWTLMELERPRCRSRVSHGADRGGTWAATAGDLWTF